MAELRTVPIVAISVPDVRVSSVLDDEQKALIEATVREIGLVSDPVVRELSPGRYELVAGRSRIQALVSQGAESVQVKVIHADEKLGLIMNITENVARGSFEYISIAQAIRKLKSLGSTDEELERIFPWSKRWINFIEQLQDLPPDIVQAVREKKLTPTHVQVSLELPTPYEVHSGLQTARDLGWDSGTLKTYVANRVEQIERLKKEAEAKGREPEIPPPAPTELIQYKQCLLCGYRKPTEQITVQTVCQPCRDLINYICGQLGQPEEAINTVYQALAAYFGQPVPPRIQPPQPRAESSPA